MSGQWRRYLVRTRAAAAAAAAGREKGEFSGEGWWGAMGGWMRFYREGGEDGKENGAVRVVG